MKGVVIHQLIINIFFLHGSNKLIYASLHVINCWTQGPVMPCVNVLHLQHLSIKLSFLNKINK
jgi:hypothetical protein